MNKAVVQLMTVLALFAVQLAEVVRYALRSNERTTRLAVLIIIVMVGLYFLH